jgi:hypothetical protein
MTAPRSTVAKQQRTRTAVRPRSLFHWRASDLSLDSVTGQADTFTRASTGSALAENEDGLRIYTAVHSQPRFHRV